LLDDKRGCPEAGLAQRGNEEHEKGGGEVERMPWPRE
jgi:hypothetical protein